ncbi:MAG: glycosyltransferase family 4 protein [Chloroflexota bacterium]
MQVLMISLDNGLLDRQNQASDSLERHLRYAQILEEHQPGSHLHILVRGGKTAVSRSISSNLTLHATQAPLPQFLRNGRQLAQQQHQQAAFDLITTQSPFWDGVLGVWLSRRFKTPLLVQLHLSSLGSAEWLNESIINRLRQRIGTFVLKRASAIRVVSKAAEEWLTKSLNIAPQKVDFLPVTAVSLTIDPSITKHPKPTVLYVGRLSKEKGVDLLLDAFTEVLKKLPTVQLQIIGDGPEREALEQQAKAIKIIENTRFSGAIPPAQIGSHYQMATVLALPSRHESFGRVIIEAFSVGLPVVATQTEGANFLIQNGKNGFLVPVEASSLLAKKLIQVCSDPQFASELGQNGYASSEAYRDINAQTRTLIKYWASII